MSGADAMEETITGACALLLLAMAVVGIVIGPGLAFWVLTVALLATFATWGAWIYLHRNDLPEEEA